MTGRMPEEGTNPVEFPHEIGYVWTWFTELHSAREMGMAGPCAISYTEMRAYFQLHDERPAGWELHLLRRLDGVALDAVEVAPRAASR